MAQVALVSLTLIQVKILDCVVTHCYVITAWKEARWDRRMTEDRFLGALGGCLKAGAVAEIAIISATSQDLGVLSQLRGGCKNQIESMIAMLVDIKLLSEKAHIQTPCMFKHHGSNSRSCS